MGSQHLFEDLIIHSRCDFHLLVEYTSFAAHGRGGSWPFPFLPTPNSLSWRGCTWRQVQLREATYSPQPGVTSLEIRGKKGYDSWQLMEDRPFSFITTSTSQS